MKKTIVILLAVLMLLTGCSKPAKTTENETTADPLTEAAPEPVSPEERAAILEEFKTIGDILESESVLYETSSMFNEDYVYVFDIGDTIYRAVAPVSAETSEAIWALDFFDEDHDKKLTDLVSPLVIDRIEDLNEMIPTQEELDKLKGKTGEELLADNWYPGGHDADTMQFWMYHGPYYYTVTFRGRLLNSEAGEEEMIKRLTVKSVEYFGLGDPTNLD